MLFRIPRSPMRQRIVRVGIALGMSTWSASPARAQQSGDDSARVVVRGVDSVLVAPSARIRLEVSLRKRMLWVVAGTDTLRAVPIAVASGSTLQYGGRRWLFRLAPGFRTVQVKREQPLWIPPDWHYAEAALAHDLRVQTLPPRGVRLRDGRRLQVLDSVVGVITDGDPYFNPLPVDEHIVFDSILYIPPVGTLNRQLSGELGQYALDLGDGYLLHGTRDRSSIGTATTHGCIRMGDDDLAWVFAHTPVGAIVRVR